MELVKLLLDPTRLPLTHNVNLFFPRVKAFPWRVKAFPSKNKVSFIKMSQTWLFPPVIVSKARSCNELDWNLPTD